MKLSNKILLGTLLFVLLFITGHYLSLYIKFKTGHYLSRTDINEKAESFEDNFPPGIKFIVLKGCDNADITSSDTMHYLIGKDRVAELKREIRNDTLFLDGSYITYDTIYEKDKILRIDTNLNSFNGRLSLHIINDEKVIANLSRLDIYLAGKYGDINLDLINSSLSFTTMRDHDTDAVICKSLRKLQVHALVNSSITLDDNCNADDLEIKLADKCTFTCGDNVSINRAEIQYSDSSDISMEGEQLKSTTFIYARESDSIPAMHLPLRPPPNPPHIYYRHKKTTRK